MQNIKETLKTYNFSLKKKYGQNFLVDDNILRKIVDVSNIPEDTLVIEIGVGAGSLTTKIAEVAKVVIGYEIDEKLKPIIEKNLNSNNNVHVIYDDFLKRNVTNDISNKGCSNIYVIANLPYYITTPIISKLIEENIDIDKMIIMVQKEVGARLCAKPDEKDYNSLTIFINYYFEVSKLFDVSKNVFLPKPNVDSSIMMLKKRKNKLHLSNEKMFFKLVRDAFRYKRKNLKNNLLGYDLEKISKILKKYDLDQNVRAEHLTIEQFADIANNL